jgi:hypothetical protein
MPRSFDIYAFDPEQKAVVPLSALSPAAWTPEDHDPDGATPRLGVYRARRIVGTLYRCVDIRAKAVAHVPFALELGGKDVTDDDAMQPLIGRIRRMLHLSEAALCCYGAYYYELGTNIAGRNLTPFWLAPQTVTPITSTKGLEGFRRVSPGGVSEFRQKLRGTDPAQFKGLLYGWLPSIEDELGPDVAPAVVALTKAGVIRGLDGTLASFFNRGLIKMTLFQVEGNRQPQDMEKLQTWVNRVMTGVKNAWRSVIIRDSIKPIVIGDGVKDIGSPEIERAAREGIAETMGVPQSMLMSDVLAGGTVEAEQVNFYEMTVIPQCELIQTAYNDQYLARLDMRMYFDPDKLPVMQAAQLRKAKAVSELVPGTPILTVDEARALLNYGPMPAALAAPMPAGGEGDEATGGEGDEATGAGGAEQPAPIDEEDTGQ